MSPVLPPSTAGPRVPSRGELVLLASSSHMGPSPTWPVMFTPSPGWRGWGVGFQGRRAHALLYTSIPGRWAPRGRSLRAQEGVEDKRSGIWVPAGRISSAPLPSPGSGARGTWHRPCSLRGDSELLA